MIENKNNFQIVPYPDMSVLEKNRLWQLMIMERGTWGYEGYGEYARCKNYGECGAMLSIEDVHGVKKEDGKSLKELEKESMVLPNCPETCHRRVSWPAECLRPQFVRPPSSCRLACPIAENGRGFLSSAILATAYPNA